VQNPWVTRNPNPNCHPYLQGAVQLLIPEENRPNPTVNATSLAHPNKALRDWKFRDSPGYVKLLFLSIFIYETTTYLRSMDVSTLLIKHQASDQPINGSGYMWKLFYKKKSMCFTKMNLQT
jgi:hypothetical protein